MKNFLSKLFVSVCIFQAFQNQVVNSGLNQFTEIDSLGKWIIEQKFDSADGNVECRASMEGYGTLFGERIRLDVNDQILFPQDAIYRNDDEIFDSLIEVKKALSVCRSGLLYIRK